MTDEQGMTLSEAIDHAIAADPNGDPAVIAQRIISSDFLALLTEEIKLRVKRELQSHYESLEHRS